MEEKIKEIYDSNQDELQEIELRFQNIDKSNFLNLIEIKDNMQKLIIKLHDSLKKIYELDGYDTNTKYRGYLYFQIQSLNHMVNYIDSFLTPIVVIIE